MNGHVRLMAALIAAAAVHALFLALPYHVQWNLGAREQTMEISLLPPVQVRAVSLAPQKRKTDHPGKKTGQTAKAPLPSEKIDAATIKPLMRPLFHGGKQKKILASESRHKKLFRKTGSQRAKPHIRPVPPNVQGSILARVSYPKVARRHGWEGTVELRLHVHSKRLEAVYLLVSSGYPVLDQAARRGLMTTRRLPLHDGTYKLPVEFRLQ